MAEPAPASPGAPVAWGIQAPSIGWTGQIGAARAALQQAISDRQTADLRLTYIWIALFYVSPIVKNALLGIAWAVFWATLNIWAALFFVLLAGLASSILHGTVNRKLIRRMTRHFDREARLRQALIDYLHAKASNEGQLDKVASSLLQMATIHGQAIAEDRGRSVWWSIATALPIIRYYFLWFINKFPAEHEQRFFAFLNHAGAACAGLGVPFRVPPMKPVKRHNFWLFLAISILTSELFVGIWYIFLVRDPHRHFDNHIAADDALSLAAH